MEANAPTLLSGQYTVAPVSRSVLVGTCCYSYYPLTRSGDPESGSPDLVRLISICILAQIYAKKMPQRTSMLGLMPHVQSCARLFVILH